MALISRFDPWRSNLCTCPPKLTFNPYTGCDHACVYCYASSYIPRFSECRPKRDLLQRLQREAAKLKGEIVSIANSSDPYPRIEAEALLTRMCLAILAQSHCRIQIITKSTLVTRDVDLLGKVPSAVALTITTDDEDTARLLEPHVPSPAERLKTVETLISKGFPVSVRVDPIIPFVNDNPERLIAALASIGVKHLTASTYKIKPDNWRRFSTAMPRVAEKLKPLYFEQGEKAGGYTLLPHALRLKLLSNIRRLAAANGMRFGVCREGLTQLNTAACDGSWLLHAYRR
ncbi:MAG: radical SAM protein [Candidatus Bathyarchaeia archaeon]